jgi:hypothetical protein
MKDLDLQTLLQFFKVMANESRLKLVGILAHQECSVEELAAMLQLKEPTVSHHLSKLKALNLVQMRPEGNTHFYRLDSESLLALNKAMLNQGQMSSLAESVQGEAWEKQVLRNYFEGDRLLKIPANRRKRWVILKWLAQKFDLGLYYSEKAVNEVLQQFHPDSATLRREMIGYQMLQRESSIYWRLPEAEWQTID